MAEYSALTCFSSYKFYLSFFALVYTFFLLVVDTGWAVTTFIKLCSSSMNTCHKLLVVFVHVCYKNLRMIRLFCLLVFPPVFNLIFLAFCLFDFFFCLPVIPHVVISMVQLMYDCMVEVKFCWSQLFL